MKHIILPEGILLRKIRKKCPKLLLGKGSRLAVSGITGPACHTFIFKDANSLYAGREAF
jgi:hypothetical protein